MGSGGAGRVYRGFALDTGERVAVKVFHAHRMAAPEFARRFDREVALSRTLDHPGVVRLRDKVTSVDSKSVALVMEYVDGHTLRPLLKKGALPPKVALDFAARIADILTYVHRKGVAHLDLKPENVLVVDVSTVRLMDFGISQATHGQLLRDGMKTQNVSGTPLYMAPEQFSGEAPLDHRADLYSLGVMLHEMLTGEKPLGVMSLGGLFHINIQQEAEALIGKLLQVEPTQRYQIAADVADKIRQLAKRLDSGDTSPRVAPVSRPDAAGRGVAAPAPAPARAPAKPKEAVPSGVGATLRAIGSLLLTHYWIVIALMFFALLIAFYHFVDFAFTH